MGAVAGSSQTPLAEKLGVGIGTEVVVLDRPDDVDLDLPGGAVTRGQLRGSADVVVAFETRLAHLEGRFERLAAAIFPAGGLWVAWPKRSSGVPTDITDDRVRQLAIPRGLVDNKVCAVDGTWTALRVVWRREHRT